MLGLRVMLLKERYVCKYLMGLRDHRIFKLLYKFLKFFEAVGGNFVLSLTHKKPEAALF
jgi:hypothetical protein